MSKTNINIGKLGETAVALELIKLGYDVVNMNSSHSNYKNIDLICINPTNGKSIAIQVKSGTTDNILTGFTSELDGNIPNIKERIVCPWIFVEVDKNTLQTKFYILSRDEALELIESSNRWYVTAWNRKLKSKPVVGISVSWLQGDSEIAVSTPTKQRSKFDNPLGHNAIDKWEKITKLIE
jgi:hypothetical protein